MARRCGVYGKGGKQAHVLHLFAPKAALVLDQVAVPQPKGAIAATKTWLEQVATEFPSVAILTGDAQLADRDLCMAISGAHRDDVWRRKKPPNALSGRPGAGCRGA